MTMTQKQIKEALREGSTMSMMDELIEKMQLDDEERKVYDDLVMRGHEASIHILMFVAYEAGMNRS